MPIYLQWEVSIFHWLKNCIIAWGREFRVLKHFLAARPKAESIILNIRNQVTIRKKTLFEIIKNHSWYKSIHCPKTDTDYHYLFLLLLGSKTLLGHSKFLSIPTYFLYYWYMISFKNNIFFLIFMWFLMFRILPSTLGLTAKRCWTFILLLK